MFVSSGFIGMEVRVEVIHFGPCQSPGLTAQGTLVLPSELWVWWGNETGTYLPRFPRTLGDSGS